MTGIAEAILKVRQQRQNEIYSMKNLITGSFPVTVEALKMIDSENTMPKRRKGFNLVKRESKKHGFLYYARFSHNGKMLPTMWNTRTNNIEAAEKFAMENKGRLVEGYLGRQDGRMYKAMEEFYGAANGAEITTYHLSERCMREYRAVIVKKFIPFLKSKKIAGFDQINTEVLVDFQDHLFSRGVKPQSVNNSLKPVRKMFEGLTRKKIFKEDPGKRLRGLPVHDMDQNARGCYETEKLKGVFNKKWSDDTLLLLNLLIYTTGMRNSEIAGIRLEDIILIKGCRFIRIKKSKTTNGARSVPLHDFVYRKLETWALKNNKKSLLFDYRLAGEYTHANTMLGKYLGLSEEEIEAENITFYSGRHFWKTLMSAEGLGEDIEEVFMGHKVSADVRKRYNHRDKQGMENLAKKARQVFAILDCCIFNTKQ